MNKVFRYVYYFFGVPFLKFVNKFIPKDDKIIVFSSTPDFADNSWFLYKKIIENECMKQKEFKYVWIVYGLKTPVPDIVKNNPNTVVIQRYTIERLKYTFIAKYFVSSHYIPLYKSDEQIGIYITHGLPLKTWAFQAKDRDRILSILERKIRNLKNYYIIVTSKYSVKLLSDLTGVNENRILPLGYPRNDVLIELDTTASFNIKNILNIPPDAKLIVYLPTFRRGGRSKEIIENLYLSDKMNSFLNKNNIFLIIKPHPIDEILFQREGLLQNKRNILLLTNKFMSVEGIQLYEMLKNSDMLITDYSSISFDYLYLNKPIIFYVPDLEEYEKERGIYLKPYEKWTPGDKVKTIEELIYAVEKNLNNPDLWERERLRIRDIMFEYVDENSSDRIINYFWCNSEKE